MRQSLERAGSAQLSVDRFILAGQVRVPIGIAAAPELALAQTTMPGQQLLLFARTCIIAPIALFGIVITGVAAFIRPDLIKATGYIEGSRRPSHPPAAATLDTPYRLLGASVSSRKLPRQEMLRSRLASARPAYPRDR